MTLNDLTARQREHAAIIAAALRREGFNQRAIAAILANVEKETGLSLTVENLNYSRTSNDRIRAIFGARVSGLTDADIDSLKVSPQRFAEAMYGKATDIGRRMGNIHEGDGWRYRGRGYVQLTGRTNYVRASQALYGDDRLAYEPDLVSTPEIAARVLAWYCETAGAVMARRMQVDLAKASQDELNLVYTSAIAGRPITRGAGYLGGEVMQKVDRYSDRWKEV